MQTQDTVRLGRWLTPRFPLEMVVVAALTAAVTLAVTAGRHDDEATAAPAKVAMKAAPLTAPQIAAAEQRTSDFMEKVALAHVAPPRVEPENPSPAPSLPSNAFVVTQKPSIVRDRPHPTTLARPVTTAPLSPQPVPLPAAPPSSTADNAPRPRGLIALDQPPHRKHESFHTRIISAVTSHVPSGHDIADGVTSLGRRIGSIFDRS